MNFLPKDLKTFLEDYKKIHNKSLSALLGISDSIHTGVFKRDNTFEIDFSNANINTEYIFLLSIYDLFLEFETEDEMFSISVMIKDNNGNITNDGIIYTGLSDKKKFRNNSIIGDNFLIKKPCKIFIKINSKVLKHGIANVRITVGV